MPAGAQITVPCSCTERHELYRRVQRAENTLEALQRRIEEISVPEQELGYGTIDQRFLYGSLSSSSLSNTSSSGAAFQQGHDHNQMTISPPPPYSIISEAIPRELHEPSQLGNRLTTKRTSPPKTTTITQVGRIRRFIARLIGIAWALW